MSLKPLHDRIIVEPAEAETTTSSGIILPDSAQEKPQKGTVLAVGPGKILDNGKKSQMDVKAGDVVLYGKFSGTEVKLGAKEYVIIRQDDILAVVEGKAAKKEVREKVAVGAGGGKKGKK